MTAVVVADVGKSGLRLNVRDGETVHSASDDLPLSPADSDDHGEQVGRRLIALLRGLALTSSPSAVVVGATADFDEQERESLAGAIHETFPGALVAACDDGTLTHARLVGGVGSLLSVGTGVIAIALDEAGVLRRFDGWGPLLGDRGGAADLGREALRLAHRQHDHGVESRVRAAAVAAFGSPSTTVARRITADPHWPVRLAHFGGDVARLAEDGCETAAALVEEAAERLADTAVAAAVHSQNPEVVVTGRFGSLSAVDRSLRRALGGRGLVLVRRDTALHDLDVDRLLTGPHRSALHVTPPRRSG